MLHKNQKSGFALIALLIVVAIIAIWAAMYYGGSGSGASVKKTGQKAIEQTKQNNGLELQNNLEIQNELNSVDR